MFTVKHNPANDTYLIEGYLGHSLSRIIKSKLLSRKKTPLILNRVTVTSIELYTFFVLEFVEALRFYMFKFSENRYVKLDVMGELIKVLEEETWLNNKNVSRNDKLHYKNIEEKMKFKILPHQKEAFEFYEKVKNDIGLRGGLLDAEPGTGKTFMSLALVEAINAKRVIIVCPKPALTNPWVTSLTTEVYKMPQKYSMVADPKWEVGNEKFIICHYDALDKLQTQLNKIPTTDLAIIVDESHFMADPKSLRTSLFLEICKELDPDDIILLSGTPVKAYNKDLVPMLTMIDKRLTGPVERRYNKLYAGGVGIVLNGAMKKRFRSGSVKIFKKDTGLGKLEETYVDVKLKNGRDYTLDNIRLRMKKYTTERVQVLTRDYPIYEATYFRLYESVKEDLIKTRQVSEKDFHKYEDDISKIKKAYERKNLMLITETLAEANKFEKEVIAANLAGEDKKSFVEAKTIYKYMALKIQGECLANVVGKARIDCHRDIVRELDFDEYLKTTTKKSILFSNYVEVLKETNELLSSRGYNTANVYGEYVKDLSKTVKSFKTDKNINPILATFQSLSTAVPLTEANVVIFLNNPFRAHIEQQAISRAYRLGQDKTVYVYKVRLDTGDEPNINGRDIDIIEWSKEEIGKITGYKTKESPKIEDLNSGIEAFIEEVPQLNLKSSNSLIW
jgi:hypothetical protein